MPIVMPFIIEQILRIVLAIVELALAIPLGYLALLSVSALISALAAKWRAGKAAPAEQPTERPRFALLIPAHNEALTIRNLLDSIAALDYPRDRFEPIVVADNCTDLTATIAENAGATVYRREHDTERAKGYALKWLLERLKEESRVYDAYIIIDADSRVTVDFLTHMERALAGGERVIQGCYLVENAGENASTGLRAVAIVLFNHVRPLGRRLFGWSAGLKGNGMCFRRDVIEQFGWDASSLAEDVEFHARLLKEGITVAYEPLAVIKAEMPASHRDARSQQARWEGGRLALVLPQGVPLLFAGLRKRNLAMMDAALEILLPPLSIIILMVLLCLVASVLSWWWPIWWLSGALVAALVVHLVAGVALARLGFLGTLALLIEAPRFILAKCGVYLTALFGRRPGSWERTARNQERRADTETPREAV